MQIKVNKTNLLTNLNFCRIFTGSQSLELFKGFLITANKEKGILIIEATNLESNIKAKIDCEIIESGKFCVNADTFIKTIKSLETEEIKIKTNDYGTSLIIGDENSNFELFLMVHEDWSDIGKIKNTDEASCLKFEGNDLHTLLDTVFPAVSETHYKAHLTGILFDINNENLKLVGSDNYKLIEIPTEKVNVFKRTISQVIIPKKVLKKVNFIIKTMKKFSTEVKISFNNVITEFYLKNDFIYLKITSRNIEDKYPEVKNFFHRKNEIELKFDKEQFIKALKKIKLLLDKNEEAIAVTEVKENKCIIKGRSDIGKIKVKCPVNSNIENFKFAFNPQNILAIEKFLPDEIILKFVDNQTPCLIQSENFNYLFALAFLEEEENQYA